MVKLAGGVVSKRGNGGMLTCGWDVTIACELPVTDSVLDRFDITVLFSSIHVEYSRSMSSGSLQLCAPTQVLR